MNDENELPSDGDFQFVDLDRLRVLADRLDCFTEDDMVLLTGNTLATLETWRKRGEGPDYIRAGKGMFLYPRAAVAEWLQTRLRARPGKSEL